jgi:excisionase family DNA binding protein
LVDAGIIRAIAFGLHEARRGRDWKPPRSSDKPPRPMRPAMTPSATIPRNDRQLVFTSSQAARYLGVSLATVRRWTDAGYVSCYRTPGGQRRFARTQLDDFITSLHREGPGGGSRTGAADASRADPSAKVA